MIDDLRLFFLDVCSVDSLSFFFLSEVKSRGLFSSDFDFIIMEDGSYHTWEEDTPINTHMIPTESNKLWNVPPPSYIRGVDISTGEYISFDDNTKPPSFDDNTAPPSFDATSGT